MFFDPHSNPTYTDHQAIAYMKLSPQAFLQVDSVMTLFTDHGKTYRIPSMINCIVNGAPFYARCILSNAYCVAAYQLVMNEPAQLVPPSPAKILGGA